MSVAIAPKFEELFPDLTKSFRKLGISVWMPFKPGTKNKPEFETIDGIPYFTAGVDHSDYQLTFKYLKGGQEHFTRENFEKRCSDILKAVRKGRREIKNETLAQRYARLRALVAAAKPNQKMLDDARARNGIGGSEYVESCLHPSGDSAVIWWSYGSIRTVQIKFFGHGGSPVFDSRTFQVPGTRWDELSFADLDAKFAEFEAKHALVEAASP